jgi:hypothetical protein
LSSDTEAKCQAPTEHDRSRVRSEVLAAGSPIHDISEITESKISDSVVRFGDRSDFGFHKPSRFFNLPSARSESPGTGFGIGSVESVHQKRRLGFFSLVARSGDS